MFARWEVAAIVQELKGVEGGAGVLGGSVLGLFHHIAAVSAGKCVCTTNSTTSRRKSTHTQSVVEL